MFIRRRSRGRALLIVESYRDQGKVRQRTLYNLGSDSNARSFTFALLHARKYLKLDDPTWRKLIANLTLDEDLRRHVDGPADGYRFSPHGCLLSPLVRQPGDDYQI